MQNYDPDGTRVKPDISCVDIWPPGTITEASIQAYKRLEAQGEIIMQSIATGRKTGIITIRYLADCPQKWMLDRLKRTRQKIIVESSEQMTL